jgi:hypothetical protein
LVVGAAHHAVIVMFSTEQPGYASWLDSPTSKGVVDGEAVLQRAASLFIDISELK